jgi:hypothetical protein
MAKNYSKQQRFMIGSLVNMGSSGNFPFIACQEMGGVPTFHHDAVR